MNFSLSEEQRMLIKAIRDFVSKELAPLEEQYGHTTDILIRQAFGNVYEVLLECKGEQIERR